MALTGMSGQELERVAALGKGNGSRFVTGKRGKRPSADIVQRIAEALHVSAAWLATGRGPMVAEGVELPNRYPNREKVAQSAECRKADEKVRDWFATRQPKDDLSVDDWHKVLAAAGLLHSVGLMFGARARSPKQSKKT